MYKYKFFSKARIQKNMQEKKSSRVHMKNGVCEVTQWVQLGA
jgi:hypothetical protein